MLLIPCPSCGSRDETEFVCGGDAERIRPLDPDACSDAEWSDYLYNSNNRKGWTREWWWHRDGCETWFRIERNTVSHELRAATEADLS